MGSFEALKPALPGVVRLWGFSLCPLNPISEEKGGRILDPIVSHAFREARRGTEPGRWAA